MVVMKIYHRMPLLFNIKSRAFGMSGISTGWLFSIGYIVGGHMVSGAFDTGGLLLAGLTYRAYCIGLLVVGL